MKPLYLLDENLQPSKKEINSPQFLPLRKFAHKGTPDWLLLEKTKENELTIITKDKGLVLRALCENQDVIFEDKIGNRFFFHGKDNFLFSESLGLKIDWKYHAKIKKTEKLSKMRTNRICLDGFDSIICI